MSPIEKTSSGKLFEVLLKAHEKGVVGLLVMGLTAFILYKWVEDGREQDRKLFQECAHESKTCNERTVYLLLHQLEASTQALKENAEINKQTTEINKKLLQKLE